MKAAAPHYMQDMEKAAPGHRFSLYFQGWKSDWTLDDTNKQDSLQNITSKGSDDVKRLAALQQRQQQIKASMPQEDVFDIQAKSTAPFVTGMGYEHPLENGFAFLNPYGLPYLPGSSVKGVLRCAAEELGIEEEAIEVLFGSSKDDEGRRGALNVQDVFPQGTLSVEIMTPHHSGYLQDKGTPHDSEQPVPIPFLTIAPNASFHFYVQRIGNTGDHDWQAILRQCFEHAFDWLGFGAKTSVGYGAMMEDPAEIARRQREEEERQQAEREQKAAEEAQRRQQEEEERRKAELAAMPEHQRVLKEAEEKLSSLQSRMSALDKSGFGELRGLIKRLLTQAEGWDSHGKCECADWIEHALNQQEHGWRHLDFSSKKRKSWETKLRTELEKLRNSA